MLPGDRLVCAFVEPQAVGFQFQKWLLHVTIVPWFRMEDSSGAIAHGLEQALQAIEPFTAEIAADALMAHNRRAAKLVKQPTPFTTIEQKVRTYLRKKRAWLVDETTKRHFDYLPHVTLQPDKTLNLGDTFRCDRLYIVEQHGNYKEIVSEIYLGKAPL